MRSNRQLLPIEEFQLTHVEGVGEIENHYEANTAGIIVEASWTIPAQQCDREGRGALLQRASALPVLASSSVPSYNAVTNSRHHRTSSTEGRHKESFPWVLCGSRGGADHIRLHLSPLATTAPPSGAESGSANRDRFAGIT